MADQRGNQQNEEKNRSKNDLLLWLTLLPIVLGSLFCCAELATLVLFPNPPANTRSLFAANYAPWDYLEIPPIDMQAVAADIIKDMSTVEANKASTVEVGILLDLPTASGDRTVTPSTPQGTPSPAGPTATSTLVGQTTPMVTKTGQGSTPSVMPRTVTVTPSRTSTKAPPPPPPTDTEAPPPPPTDTPIQPTPVEPSPTWTNTVSPSPTWTFTPSTTPSQAPYLPVLPIAEGNGASAYDAASGGCRAYFGYLNSNPQPVTIPPVPGTNNFLTGATIVQGTPPTSFKISRVFAAYSVIWTGGGNVTWTLDGNTATVFWCNPPVVP